MPTTRLRRLFAEPPSLRFSAGTRGDIEVWRRHIQATVERLGAVEDVTLSVAKCRHARADGLVRETYVMRTPLRDPVRAVLLAPPRTGPHPAVLVSPGRRATLEGVTGLEPSDYPDRDVAVRLAREGIVTLTLDYGFDGCVDPAVLHGRDESAVLAQAYALCGRPILGALVEEARAALGWLAAHPLVDSQRLGLFGHSIGAAVALHTALLHECPLPVCAASHLGRYETLYGRLCSGIEPGALPGIRRYADLPDLYAALAPAPLHIQYGTADRYLDPDDAAEAGALVRRAYAAVGAADRVEILACPMSHGTDVAAAHDFFCRVLSPSAETSPVPPVPPVRVRFDTTARREIADRIDLALATGQLTQGSNVTRFEELAQNWTGRPGAAVSSGSAALEIAYRLVGVEGRTVLMPVNTYFATAASALRAGANVDFLDIEADGLGIDPDALRRYLAAGGDVAAVTLVHIGGVVSPAVTAVLDECRERGIAVIEDAAHAIGSSLRGRAAGSFGRIAGFSFFPTKVVTSAEGGLVVADPADLALARRFRDHGKISQQANVHDLLGSNWRMSEPHAAVGAVHLGRLRGLLAERRRVAAWYNERLSAVPRLRRYLPPAGASSNFYKYVTILDDDVDRSRLKACLRNEHGVICAGEVYDTVLADQPYFAEAFAGREFPQARRFASRHLCLPIFPGMKEAQQQRTVAALQKALS